MLKAFVIFMYQMTNSSARQLRLMKYVPAPDLWLPYIRENTPGGSLKFQSFFIKPEYGMII